VDYKYVNEIKELIKKVPKEILDLNINRRRGNIPTQAFSEFLTNREQGDWAENLIFRAINEVKNGIIAVKYGKSDEIIAGEPGFKEFYEKYQNELDTIGKRPDLLVFRKKDFEFPTFDISRFEESKLKKIVPKAIAGLEIRSSSFLAHKYMEFSTKKREETLSQINKIINNLKDKISLLPNSWKTWLSEVNLKDENSLFSIPRGALKLEPLKPEVQKLRILINSLKKRDFLSFTPKVEDIYVVYKWITTFGVPHYYIQVFFDRVYAISFKKILEIISNPSNKGRIFYIEKNAKNQFKTTIHIDINQGILLAEKIDFPEHSSKYKELERGRLLFYVTFKKGKAYLDVNKFYKLIGLFDRGGNHDNNK
jgi:type II restriction enzyme